MVFRFFLFLSMKILGFSIAFCLLLYGCGKVPFPEPNEGVSHFIGDFESANLIGFYLLVNDTTLNTQIVTAPVRNGNFALKNLLQPDDYLNNGYRTELAVYNCAAYHTEVFYGFSFMADTSNTTTEFNLICQWQDLPNYVLGENWEPNPNIRGAPPPLALVLVDNFLQIKMNTHPASNNHTFIVGTPQPIIKGNWYDVVAHIFWSDNNDGFIEVWLNNTPIIPKDDNNTNKFYSSNLFNPAGNYFKFGQYKGSEKPQSASIIYFDEVKIGSSFEEVAP